MTVVPTARLLAPIPAAASRHIDILRVFLVAEVFYGHLAMIALPSYGRLDLSRWPDRAAAATHLTVRFGQQAAAVFVFLSGYFIVPRLIAIARGEQPAAPLAFLRHRFKRIYPTLLIAIALTVACDMAGIYGLGAASTYRARMSYDPVAALNVRDAVGNLLSLQPTFVPAIGSNGPLWTLGYLVQFYVAGILIAWGWSRRPTAAAVLTAALLVIAAVSRPEWLLLFLAWGLAGWVRGVTPPRRAAVLLAPAALLFVAANRLPPLGSIVLASIAGALFVVAIGVRSSAPDRPAARTIAWLSAHSYAVYAIHFPVALLLYCILIRRLGSGPTAWLPFLVGATIVVLVLAWLIERAVTRLTARRRAA